jgi:trimethylamine--corrinoid protein Co-methyltransferase
MASNIDLYAHAAGIMDSYAACSLEKFVLDCERIRYLQRFERGFDVDDESLALDLIDEIEPGDHFLNKRHTLDHSKEEFYFPDVYVRDSYDNWHNAGAKSAVENAHDRVETLLEEYERPPIDDDVERELRSYTETRRAKLLG